MTNKTKKTNAKRLPKGQRIHVRRLKQETRKAGGTYTYKRSNLQNDTSSIEKA